MAATGDDASAMDSISRAPAAQAAAAQAAALNPPASGSSQTEGPKDAAANPTPAPRKPHSNSLFPLFSAAF